MTFYHYDDIPAIRNQVNDIFNQLYAHTPHVNPLIATSQSGAVRHLPTTAITVLEYHTRALFHTITAWDEDKLAPENAYRTALDHYSMAESLIDITFALLRQARQNLSKDEVNLNLIASENLLLHLNRTLRTLLNYVYAAYHNPSVNSASKGNANDQ